MSKRTRQAEAPAIASRPGAPPALPRLLVLAVAIAASAAVLANGFTQDDLGLIANTSRLHGLAHWREILTSPYWPPPYVPDLYRPVTSLLLALQYSLGGGNPLVFRAGSMLLYAGACLALLRGASLLLPASVATLAVLLFAAHPVHAESVALAVAQGEVLVGLLGAVMVARYVAARRRADGRPTLQDWTAIAGCFVAASLAKEQGLVLPALLVLAELVFFRDAWRARAGRLWRGFAFLALLGILVLLLRRAVLGGNAFTAAAAPTLGGLTFAGRALTVLRTVPEWVRLLVWPLHLRADYSPAEFTVSSGFGFRELAGLVLLVALTSVAWVARKRAPVITFGIGWWAVMLLPVSNLFVPTGILLAERTLFSPSIGFVLALGGGVAWLVPASASTAPSRVLVGAAGLLVLAGGMRQAMRLRDYRSPEALTLASVADAPRSWRVQQAYAAMLFDRGQIAPGREAYARAIALSPQPWYLRNELAARLHLRGDEEGALEELRLSLAEHPTPEALGQLGVALLAVGKYEEVRRMAERFIAAGGAPPVMVWLKHLADSAIAVKAPPGSIRVGIGTR